MNKVDFTNVGGFPYGEDTFEFLQDGAADMFSSIANLIGDKTILSGVQVVGGNVSNGWISYGGEILKFVGGAAGPGVVIVETKQDAVFEDGNIYPVYKTRFATIGSPAIFPFSDLKPANVGMPSGTVVMWSGAVSAIPAGFALCDGNNGTPNLSGRFIVGYDAGDADYSAIGNNAGSKSHILAANNIPPLSGDTRYEMNGTDGTPNGKLIYNGNGENNPPGPGWQAGTVRINNGVTPQAIDHRPPYFTLANIIKL